MPIIDLYLPENTFEPKVTQDILTQLSKAILVCELTRDNPAAESLNWCYAHEQPKATSLIGGKREHKPHYRIELTTLKGALATRDKQEIVNNMTRILLDVEGSPYNQLNASRVWVIFHEIEEGNWAGGGQVYSLKKLKEYLQQK